MIRLNYPQLNNMKWKGPVIEVIVKLIIYNE